MERQAAGHEAVADVEISDGFEIDAGRAVDVRAEAGSVEGDPEGVDVEDVGRNQTEIAVVGEGDEIVGVRLERARYGDVAAGEGRQTD
ncbi:MAG TPA: hypothetical protein VFX03_12965, partial [Thermomicrobiales bacterium]|nr:hypothetical protein [Thermomicrobiales bacterium]